MRRGTVPGRAVEHSTARRTTLAVGAVVMLVASTIGSGAFGGTPIDEAAGGTFGSDATPLAPAGPAFGIWSVINTGLVALAAWQALPAQRRNARLARLDWLILADPARSKPCCSTARWASTSAGSRSRPSRT